MRYFIALLVVSFMALSCNSDKQSGVGNRNIPQSGTAAGSGGPPSEPGRVTSSLEITPKNAVRGSLLSLVPSGFSLDGAKIEWRVNDSIAGNASGPQFRAEEVKKGDTVEARVNIGGNEILSNRVLIMNSAPVITRVELVPDEFEGSFSLRAEASGQDVDGDQVTFTYAWTNNNIPAGAGSRIEGTLKRGDFASVTITPFDGTDYGAVAIVRREIANQRPVIAAHKEFTFQDNVYRYQVKATDADGDTLTYSLDHAEDGMSIDPVAGLITWQAPAEFKGKKSVTFSVSDGNGGSAQYSVEVIMTQKLPAK